MLRIAVPNKGSLSESSVEMLRESGYRVRRDSKELIVTDRDNDVEFFYLRPRDIAVYVGSGTVDCGITGRDLLLDSGSAAIEVMPLGFGGSTFRYAARPGTCASVEEIAGRRVATSYSGLVEKHLAGQGISAQVVRLDGAVERLLLVVAGEHPEADGHAGGDAHLGQAVGHARADVVEVRGAAPDDDTQGHEAATAAVATAVTLASLAPRTLGA